MLNVDPVKLTEAYPRSTLIARRFRAALIGKIYYFNGQKNRARVFHALNTEVQFENYVETGTFLGMTTDFLARTAGSAARASTPVKSMTAISGSPAAR